MSEDLKFEIDASIVLQLGEDLISDVVQALTELIKNSYDADAKSAKLAVYTEKRIPDERSFFRADTMGYVMVQDTGDGMSLDVIKKGWMTVSNSPKREMKNQNRTTPLGRTPLGDKGLGRLGAQRIGYNIEIFTVPKGKRHVFHVGWSWRDFSSGQVLSKVPIHYNRYQANGFAGTQIYISDLRDVDQWNKGGLEKLTTELSRMLSPYQEFQGFKVTGIVNGTRLELEKVSKRIRDTAPVQYIITFDNEQLTIDANVRVDFLSGNTADQQEIYEELILEDDGQEFVEFMRERKKFSGLGIRTGQGKRQLLRTTVSYAFDEFDKVERYVPSKDAATKNDAVALRKQSSNKADQNQPVPYSPGPFTAEINFFDLGREASNSQSVFNAASQFRNHIKKNSGVRIYRDGFAVRVDSDWLGLGKQGTSGKSWYGLKPGSTLGYVSLTAKDNSALVEMTDREGFKNTPHYRNFVLLFEQVTSYTHDLQEFIRRSWNEYQKLKESEFEPVGEEESVESIGESISEGLSRIADQEITLKGTVEQLNELRAETHEQLGSLRDEYEDRETRDALKKIEDDLLVRIQEVSGLVKESLEEVQQVSELQRYNASLQEMVEVANEQLQLGVEAMSLGITAEALAHEIQIIADFLAKKTSDIITYLKRKKISDTKIHQFVENVRSTVNGLRTQITQLEPSLRYARTRRSNIVLSEFCGELRDFHNERWSNQQADLRVNVIVNSDAVIRINKGKLLQVFNNLIFNSEYWLKEDVAAGRVKDAFITIRVNESRVTVSDNGLGIDPKVEDSLFEPFVSTKKIKRGLGLFVAQQLMDAEGCEIRLSRKRNSNRRLHSFLLDFSGCIQE